MRLSHQPTLAAFVCTKTVSCLFICATIACVAYIFAHRPEPPRRLWSPVLIGTDGKETILGDTRQLEFWTPSSRTVDYLHKENGEVISTEQWQIISNEDTLVQFGLLLHTNQNILGYRRVEVWGQGQTTFKPGWWWTVNVFTNYTADELGHVYEGFWKSQRPVFIEVIDNRGRME